MKTHMHRIIALFLVISAVFATEVQAQTVVTANDIRPEDRTEERAATTEAAESPIAVIASLTEVIDALAEQIDRQYAASLKSSDAAVREQAMQDVILIASLHGDKITFEKVVSPLLNVYIFDKDANYRLMALAALHAIGDPYGMQRLRELANDDSSERVRRLTHRALANYYGPKKNR